jgi:hypothetical protein
MQVEPSVCSVPRTQTDPARGQFEGSVEEVDTESDRSSGPRKHWLDSGISTNLFAANVNQINTKNNTTAGETGERYFAESLKS